MLKLRTILKVNLFVTIIFLSSNLLSQSIWIELSNMPMPISNNAVAEASVGDTTYVYSFGGIDSTKTMDGITRASMRYNTMTDIWSFIPDLPDSLGKIASAASTVDNIIYITGGYYVFPDSPFELSSNKVHRFDPISNSFLTDASPIPHPIDDHVQSVWRDSLIFIVTGWSDISNVPYVQIYNPYLDSWLEGTATPNNSQYKAFGASGSIVGDTIFYNGGAAGFSFNSVSKLRKGIINPDDPSDITWTILEDNPGSKGYRMAAANMNDNIYWIGGSGVTYNYDGVAYNGSGIVSPLNRILSYDSSNGVWDEGLDQPHAVMDLRGVAKISNDEFVICGGMLDGVEVSNKTFLIKLDRSSGIDDVLESKISISPNPVQSGDFLTVSPNSAIGLKYVLYNSSMQEVDRGGVQSEISTLGLPPAIYTLVLINDDVIVASSKIAITQ